MLESLTEDEIKAIVAEAVAAAFASNISPPGPPSPPRPQGPPAANNGNNGTNGWRIEDLGYFNPDLPDPADTPVKTISSHTYYRDVYVFVERLKDLQAIKGEELVRSNIHASLRGTALDWYTVQLTEFERRSLRRLPLSDGWYAVLVARFKLKVSQALNKLRDLSYGPELKGKSARAFVQTVFPQGAQGPRGVPGQAAVGTTTNSWHPDELGFFDPDLRDEEVIGKGDIVYLGSHPYYRNVFVFTERIKHVAKIKGEQAVRLNLHTCLRGTALEWYSWKLTKFEKESLSKISLEGGWITLLIEHFKERSAQAGIDVLASEGITLGLKNSHAYNRSCQESEFYFVTPPYHWLKRRSWGCHIKPTSRNRTYKKGRNRTRQIDRRRLRPSLEVKAKPHREIALPHSEAKIPVKIKSSLPDDRAFLFDPRHASTGLTVYSHAVNANMSFVTAVNRTNKPTNLAAYTRASTLSDLDTVIAYQANPTAAVQWLLKRTAFRFILPQTPVEQPR